MLFAKKGNESNILGHPKRESWSNNLGRREYYNWMNTEVEYRFWYLLYSVNQNGSTTLEIQLQWDLGCKLVVIPLINPL